MEIREGRGIAVVKWVSNVRYVTRSSNGLQRLCLWDDALKNVWQDMLIIFTQEHQKAITIALFSL
jgi:hypothetical protein